MYCKLGSYKFDNLDKILFFIIFAISKNKIIFIWNKQKRN